GGEVGQRHHLILVIADLKQFDVLRRLAEVFQRLDVDLPGSAEAIEIVDVKRTQRGFQRRANIVNRDAAVLGLGSVDDQLQPGSIGAETAKKSLQRRIGLAGSHARIGNFLKRQKTVIVRVLDDDLESSRRAQAFHRRGG